MSRKHVNRDLVRKEIIRLIRLALDVGTPIDLGDRYIYLARKFSMKYNVRIPSGYKIYICRGCKRLIKPGKTGVFRIRSRPRKCIYVKCLRCGKVYRKVYK